MQDRIKFSCSLPYNTGYEGISHDSYKEMSHDTKKFYLEVEGVFICDKCGHKSKNINEKWFNVKVINNYLPDYRMYCEKCVSKVFGLKTKNKRN